MIFVQYYFFNLKLSLFLSQYVIISSRASETSRNATLTDLSKCKLTQFGTDYMGSIMTTAGGIRCQMWYSEKPLHKACELLIQQLCISIENTGLTANETITDTDFPERSLQLARNYCRNPTKDPRGPWCYTMEPTLIDDACEIPLCNFGECRISGPGSEYGGTHDTTASGKKCKSWDKRLKLAVDKTEKYKNNQFSDLSRNKAKNFCRNPDSSTGGPWCWVDAENYEVVEKEYCSIPFCDDKDCLVYSKNASVYSIITSLNSTIGNITFWIKLWNPGDEQRGQAKLLFTNLQVPTSSKMIAQDWRAGVEIVISNSGSGQEYPRTDDETDFEATPNILLGSKWTGLWVAWGGGFISVGYHGSTKPIFLDEFKKKNTISSMYPEGFFQYGIMGTGVLWSMDLCEDTCEVHTTFGIEFLRVWPLLQSNSSHDLQFHVRASHKATIQLTQTPAVPFPCLLIILGQQEALLVMYQETETSVKEILYDLHAEHIVNFWAWHEFTISIFGTAIQMFWHRDYGREEIFTIEHHSISTLRWFSIGTENTIGHWTLFCAPKESDAVEAPWFPNCISSSSDSRYEGSQWTAENQIPCIPWISDQIPKEYQKDDIFIDGSMIKALNKCRNPTSDSEGPFCFTAIQPGSSSVKKEHCPIRKCRSSECRMAGTANDYLGTLSVTRSGRNCAPWVSEPEETTKPKKNVSLESLMARAFMSLKVKRENELAGSERWEEIGLRSRLPRESGQKLKEKTSDSIPKLLRNNIDDLFHSKSNIFGKRKSLENNLESLEDDYDEDWDKLKSANFSSSTLPSSSNDTSKNSVEENIPNTTPRQISNLDATTTRSNNKNNVSKPIHEVDPRYLNDTLYPEQSARNASNYCRNPSRNVAGTWCYTTDPEVPQDLCNVRDCEQPEECIFLVRGNGNGRRLYVLPEYRSQGLHFFLKEWEPDRPDSITFVILSEDDIKSRIIFKIGAMKNEKVILYHETKDGGIKLAKQKTLPHLLYLGKWTGFVIRMDRGEIKLYYGGAPYPLFEWKDPEPAKAFLPVYYYYTSELGNSIGVAFNCDTKCHIEQTTTHRFSRILPISIWEKEETPSPRRLALMIRGEGVILLPLLMMPGTSGYYALTIGEIGQWIFFVKNKLPVVHVLHKQDANGPLFTSDSWTNITVEFYNSTIQVLRNGTKVFHYIHNLPLLFYFFSISVDPGGWVTWAANCVPTDIDGDPVDGGWSEWGPWSCSVSCNGGMGIRKRTCDNPEPNIRGQPCLGPSTSSGRCNMNKCGDVTDVTLAMIQRRIRIQHESIIINEGDPATLSSDTDIVPILKNETSNSEMNWSRNGIYLEKEKDRVKLEDTGISISYAVLNDSGVYTQTLHRVDDSYLVFKIITLAIIPTRSELVIRETLSFSITCHCVVLGYIYSDLKVSWILNGKVFKDYGVSTPVAVNVDYIPKANTSHHGEWRCEVVQSDLNFKWITNIIKVRVLGPPNWRTNLMEDKLTRPIFGWMPSEGFVAFSAFFFTVIIIVAIVASTIWYLRFQDSLKYKDSEKKKLIENEESLDDSDTEKVRRS